MSLMSASSDSDEARICTKEISWTLAVHFKSWSEQSFCATTGRLETLPQHPLSVGITCWENLICSCVRGASMTSCHGVAPHLRQNIEERWGQFPPSKQPSLTSARYNGGPGSCP
jgi:hypothetical protein